MTILIIDIINSTAEYCVAEHEHEMLMYSSMGQQLC